MQVHPASGRVLRPCSHPSRIEDINVAHRSCKAVSSPYDCVLLQTVCGVINFANIASPLHALTKNARFQWSEECQAAFDHSKQRLVNGPILAYPSFNREFLLETDASMQGLGAVLLQVQDDGLPHPVAYASRALTPAEKKHGITYLETLVVVWSVPHSRVYLYGQPVKVFTDHASVKAVLLKQ